MFAFSMVSVVPFLIEIFLMSNCFPVMFIGLVRVTTRPSWRRTVTGITSTTQPFKRQTLRLWPLAKLTFCSTFSGLRPPDSSVVSTTILNYFQMFTKDNSNFYPSIDQRLVSSIQNKLKLTSSVYDIHLWSFSSHLLLKNDQLVFSRYGYIKMLLLLLSSNGLFHIVLKICFISIRMLDTSRICLLLCLADIIVHSLRYVIK